MEIDIVDYEPSSADIPKPHGVDTRGPDLLKRIGIERYARGDLAGAEQVFRQALAQTPHDPDVLVSLGRIYYDMQYYEEALECLKAAVDIDPEDAEAWVGVALIAQRFDDQETFQVAFQQARRLDPAHPRVAALARDLGRTEFRRVMSHGTSHFSNEFQRRLFCGLIRDGYGFQDNDVIFRNLTVEQATEYLVRTLQGINEPQRFHHLQHTLHNINRLERFYHLLENNHSKQLLIELLKFKILGARRVKLPLNTEEYWELYASVDKHFLQERGTIKTGRWVLNRYKLQGLNGPIHLHAPAGGVLNTFLLEQYTYNNRDQLIQVQPGDVVIDGGACWGDTALYFADKAGAQGKVYCFEFVPDNLEILRQNLGLNPSLAGTIEVISKALLDVSGKMVSYSPRGPSTWLESNEEQLTQQVSTVSIDDFVKEEGIARVDFIKMDVEGSELKALEGAEGTICAFKPKLAIALYHRIDDFVVIPEYLAGLELGYKFFLDHFTTHNWETVLFASPKAD